MTARVEPRAAPALRAAPEIIDLFVRKLFAYADPGTFVSLRAFRHRGGAPVWPRGYNAFPAEQIGKSLDRLVDRLTRAATWAANQPDPTVFCPPMCTLSSAAHARESDMANGLALAVECDQAPDAAVARLKALLGAPTLIVASGGEWTDPATGERQKKLHLYWRLSEPTRCEVDHRRLKRARDLAARLIGADISGVPIVHPMRLPGSWHTKAPAAPRLVTVHAHCDNEIDLADAAEMLETLAARGAGERGLSSGRRSPDHWALLAEGVHQGTTGRINAITSVIGYLLAKGVEPHLAAALTRGFNATLCFPPERAEKVEEALESIAARELEKMR